jgi:ribosomal protein S18 acetylase RimI-like enzyme
MISPRYIIHEAKEIGIPGAYRQFSHRILNKAVNYQVLKGMKITMHDLSPSSSEHSDQFEGRFLDYPTLLELSKDPDSKLPLSFVDEAVKRGDECYGLWNGKELAGYGWYSKRPTAIRDGLFLHFDDGYIYMYKGYTKPNYRGQRVHSLGMAQALKAYSNQGYKGFVSYVESHNVRSLRSVYRLGYADIGKIFILRAFGRYLIHHSYGCDKFKFHVRSTLFTN